MANPQMTFPKAKQEFDTRYYLWAKSEFEQEIETSFPTLQMFTTGPAWQLYQFMQRLDRQQQLTLANSLIKRFHPDAVKALAEICSAEEELLRRSLDRFRQDAASNVELEVDARRRAGERVRFMSKRKLLNVTAQRFRDSFGSQCVESDRVLARDPSLQFQTTGPGGWIISTHFWFGRGESLIDYSHAIFSELTFEHHGPKGPYTANLVIGSLISVCSWLGICSQTQWEYLTDDEEVGHACDAVIKFCGRFFEVAPKILKGLEVDTITWP